MNSPISRKSDESEPGAHIVKLSYDAALDPWVHSLVANRHAEDPEYACI
jgi:hypothetical protein